MLIGKKSVDNVDLLTVRLPVILTFFNRLEFYFETKKLYSDMVDYPMRIQRELKLRISTFSVYETSRALYCFVHKQLEAPFTILLILCFVLIIHTSKDSLTCVRIELQK